LFLGLRKEFSGFERVKLLPNKVLQLTFDLLLILAATKLHSSSNASERGRYAPEKY